MQYVHEASHPSCTFSHARVPRLKQRIERVFTSVMNPPARRDGAKPVTAYLSLSFGVVTDRDGPFGDVRSLAEAVARSRGRASETGKGE